MSTSQPKDHHAMSTSTGHHAMLTSRPKEYSNFAFLPSQWRHSVAKTRNRVFHSH